MSLLKFAKSLLNKPLEEWSEGQLKFETASLLNLPEYIIMQNQEKKDLDYPITKEDMITYLRSKGQYK